MGDGLGKPEEYDRYEPPYANSSNTYFPSGDHLAAYGGRSGMYPGFPTTQALGPDPHLRPSPGLSSYQSPPPGARPPIYGGSLTSALGPSSPLRQAAGYHSTMGSAPMDTLIIWDWDDTLMCSHAINTGRLPGGSCPQLEVLLEECLRFSMTLGETIIVTNADDLWVFESARRFAPRVLELLSSVPVLSARRKHEAKYPGDVFAWKRETFREILLPRQHMQGLNLVVIGDSPSEIEAAQTCLTGLSINPILIKTVKLKEQPSCEELCEQQRILLQDLASIVQEDRDTHRNLVASMRSSSSYLTSFLGTSAASSVPPSPYSRAPPQEANYALRPDGTLMRSSDPSYHQPPRSNSYLSSPMMYAS